MSQRKAKQLGLQLVDCNFGVFDFGVYCVAGDYNQALKYVSYVYEEKDPEDLRIMYAGNPPRGQCFGKTGFVPIIWIPTAPVTAQEYGTLAHECVHAVMQFLEWGHIEAGYNNDETMAHVVGFLVRSIIKGLK